MNKQPVYYMQTDGKWKNKDYSAPGEKTTIGKAGCGPSCAAMLISTIKGNNYTPEDACKYSLEHGYKATNQGTYYAYFEPQFKEFGIECKQLNYTSAYGNKKASVHKTAFDLLKQGYYIIACMGKGLWTSSGHFIVVWWEDGKVKINDPYSKKAERLNGDLELFKSQVKYYWSVDARQFNNAKEKYYCVQVGSFLSKNNALKYEKNIKAKGFETYIAKVGNYWKIQIGAYKEVKNAQNMIEKVKKAGFDAFITTKNI